MNTVNTGNGLKVRAHKGDAMTLLAFDLAESKSQNFNGFTIRVTAGTRAPYYMTNLLKYPAAILKKNNIKSADAGSTLYAAIQKYRWVHVPATFHQIQSVFYGTYKYDVTPRYLVDDVLQPLDSDRTVTVSIDVSPFQSGKFQIGFTRGFVASQAYVNHFGNNSKVRPNKTDLIFDIHSKSGSVRTKNGQKASQDYTFEDQHAWMGWQARARVLEFLDETLADSNLMPDAFAFDLDEPLVCDRLLTLGRQGRCLPSCSTAVQVRYSTR